jgi:ribosomal protein S27AE
MKTTSTCAKCGSSDILRIPGQTGPFGAGNNIPVGRTIFASIHVARFICGQCGYSEEWVEVASDLAKLRERYASG